MNLPPNASDRTRRIFDRMMSIPAIRKLDREAKERLVNMLMAEQEQLESILSPPKEHD